MKLIYNFTVGQRLFSISAIWLIGYLFLGYITRHHTYELAKASDHILQLSILASHISTADMMHDAIENDILIALTAPKDEKAHRLLMQKKHISVFLKNGRTALDLADSLGINGVQYSTLRKYAQAAQAITHACNMGTAGCEITSRFKDSFKKIEYILGEMTNATITQKSKVRHSIRLIINQTDKEAKLISILIGCIAATWTALITVTITRPLRCVVLASKMLGNYDIASAGNALGTH